MTTYEVEQMQMHIYFPKPLTESANRYRGIGFYTDNLINNLKQRQVKVDFFNSEKSFFSARSSRFQGQGSSIIHYPYFFPYFLTTPRRKKFPRVITVHDLIPLKFPKLYPAGIRGRIKWEINKKIIQAADVIITDSLTSKNDIASLCWGIDIAKVHIVPLAADPIFKPINNPIFPKTLKLFNSNKLRNFVLYVGDVNPSKNLSLLVNTCVKLGIPLVLVGKKFREKNYDHDHPENQDLVVVQKMADKHPELIFMPGFVSSQDLVNLYNLATVYCQPSWEEGFGLPVLEAMACGCPTAVSQTSSLIEITKTDAFLFDPSSEESLVNALQDGLSHPKKRQVFSTAGLLRAKEYSWERTARLTIDVYQKVLDNN